MKIRHLFDSAVVIDDCLDDRQICGVRRCRDVVVGDGAGLCLSCNKRHCPVCGTVTAPDACGITRKLVFVYRINTDRKFIYNTAHHLCVINKQMEVGYLPCPAVVVDDSFHNT